MNEYEASHNLIDSVGRAKDDSWMLAGLRRETQEIAVPCDDHPSFAPDEGEVRRVILCAEFRLRRGADINAVLAQCAGHGRIRYARPDGSGCAQPRVKVLSFSRSREGLFRRNASAKARSSSMFFSISPRWS